MYKILVSDIDGTLTDGKLYYSSEGESLKVFSVKDGMAFKKLKEDFGMVIVLITGRDSIMNSVRATELGLDGLYQGVSDKVKQVNEILTAYNFTLEELIYVGDDYSDIGVMSQAGLSFAPSDGVNQVKKTVDVVTSNPGGCGVITNIYEYLLGVED